MSRNSYSPTEMLVCLAARLMKNMNSVFIGTGIPMLAAALAKRLYNPHLLTVFEFGGMGSTLEELPLGVGESRTFKNAIAAFGICQVMETAQRGLIHYGFLGGAQIDAHGNLNTTIIGSHNKPKVRFPGSGGGNDVGSLCWKTIILMKHEKFRFVKKVDFVTTPGYLTGPGAREAAGLPSETGPEKVLTNLGVFDFEKKSRAMRLTALNPRVSLQDVQRSTSFDFPIAKKLLKNAPPTLLELKTIREKVDPKGIFLKE